MMKNDGLAAYIFISHKVVCVLYVMTLAVVTKLTLCDGTAIGYNW